jgi:hypothetical protein
MLAGRKSKVQWQGDVQVPMHSITTTTAAGDAMTEVV